MNQARLNTFNLSQSLRTLALTAFILPALFTFAAHADDSAVATKTEKTVETTTESKETKTETKKPKAKSETKSPNKTPDKKAAKGAPVDAKHPVVMIETSMGPIEVKLNAEKAPVSVENFLKYVDEGFYNGTIFHRVIDGFMIQGGGFDEKFDQKKTHAPIKNEATNGLKNDNYTLAMARTNDVNSATAQFFINVKDNGFLNNSGTSPMSYGYAVFGEVVGGKDVVDKIRAVPTTNKGPYENVPVTPVVMKSVTRK